MSTPPFLDLPACARRADLPTARGPLAAYIAAPAEGAPHRGTVLLVPGFTGSKEDFVAVLDPMTTHGWAVVAIDQRGQYESAGPDEESAYTLPRLAADLLDVAELLEPPVHVVGHSFGGLVAREAVLASGGTPFASLTLLCSGPAEIPPQHHESLGVLVAALPHVPLAVVYDVKESQDREAGIPEPAPEVAAFLRERFTSTNPYQLKTAAATLMSTPDRTDELAALAREGFRVAVVYGPDDDAWSHDDQHRVAEAVGARAIVVPDSAHSPAAENPQGTADVLDELLTSWSDSDLRSAREDRGATSGQS